MNTMCNICHYVLDIVAIALFVEFVSFDTVNIWGQLMLYVEWNTIAMISTDLNRKGEWLQI